MPAQPTRIGFVTQEFRLSTAGPDSGVTDLYGNSARDTLDPVETFFDDIADAQAMADERLGLLGVQRSLVTASVSGFDATDNLTFAEGLPTVTIIDDEQDRNGLGLVVGMQIDKTRDRVTLEVWS